MASSRQLVEFLESDPTVAIGWVEQVVDRARGEWVNLEPVVDEEAGESLAVRRGAAGWLSGRGSDLPYATVVGPTTGRRPVGASLGLQHGGGPKASRVLAAGGIVAPESWLLRQDHPKRGLVYEQRGDIDAGATVAFVLAAANRLCPVELDGRWSAVMHRVG